MDGEIVGAGCEEGRWWVEGACIEDCVDGDGEEGGECFVEGERRGEVEGFLVWRGSGGHGGVERVFC